MNNIGRIFTIITFLFAIALLFNALLAILFGEIAGKIIGLVCYIIFMGFSLNAK